MISDEKKTEYVNFDNKKIPVWIYGAENKTIIYFIHGYFRAFSNYVGDLPPRHLKKDYKVIAFDLPGYGYSKNLSMDEVEFINEIVINTSQNKSFYIFGSSFGGYLSLKYIKEYPKKVNGIIIAGLPYFYGYSRLISLIRYLPVLRKKSLTKVIGRLIDLNVMSLSEIDIPVLLLYSSKDNYATPRMGYKLSTKLKKSVVFVINKYKHSWLLHNIKENGFLAEIKKFIDAN